MLVTTQYSLFYQATTISIQIQKKLLFVAQWLTRNRLTNEYTILSLFSQGVLRDFSNFTIIYRKLFTKRIWMKVCKFVTMSSKLQVFIGLLQKVFVVSKRIYFFPWAYVWRVWSLEHLMLALNTRTPSYWKTSLVSFHVDHYSRKPLALSQSMSITSKACLMMMFGNFQILNFIYSS